VNNASVAWFVVAAPLLLWGAWLSRRRAGLADTPRSRCAAVFVGFNEITGAVETVQPTRSWFTDTLSAWWRSELEEEREYTRTETTTDAQGHTQTRTVVEHRFVQVEAFTSEPLVRLADETGRVLVDLTRASMSVPASYREVTRDPKWSEPKHRLFTATTGRYRQQEWTLIDGQQLLVLGGAKIDDSGSDVVVDGDGPGEFLVTTRTEKAVTTGRRVGTWSLLVLGVAAAACGGGAVDRAPLSYVAGGLVAALLVVAWGTFDLYNRLVRLRQLQERAWSLIDVQLARRATLIPQLVEVVKGYAAHEAGLQAALAAGRSMSAGALLALREAYPQLKADTVYQRLFDELTATDNRIGGARDYFNEAVTILRDRTRTFPGILLAGRVKAGRFGTRDLIVAGQEEQARPPENAKGPAEAGP
jgi:hypothetical protein